MGVPEGYCGICERCGEPGHTQHFPGPAPYTGAWCDRCVKVVQVLYWLKAILIFAVIALLLWSLVSLVW